MLRIGLGGCREGTGRDGTDEVIYLMRVGRRAE
jgi:hypothetical protein